jgi:polysaccharide biosynthesis transport protein
MRAMETLSGSSVGDNSRRGDAEPSALTRYLQTLRGHIKLIIACVIVTLLAAGAYVKLAPRTYTADAMMLINPASSQDTVLFSLPVLHSSGDPTQDVLTASALITSQEVAQATVKSLHLHESASTLLGKIQAVPLDQSNIISVEATDSTPQGAQRIANEFARQAVVVRTARLHQAIATVIPGLKTSVSRLPASQRNGTGSLGDQLTQLEQLQSSSDPTISVSSQALLPLSPTSPRTTLSLAAGLLAGLLIGIGAAFAIGALDPRVQREEQLYERFPRIPVLARVPDNHVPAETGPLTPADLPPTSFDQYRLLRAVLTARHPAPQAFLMTGSAPAEGKTTSAINLSAVLAKAGANVILIDADLRRPSIATTLGMTRGPWIEDVLSGTVSLSRALSATKIGTESVLVLPANGNSGYRAERLSLGTARSLVSEAKRLADYVVIDSPPLTAVIEALPFAQAADDVLVAVRMGHSRMSNIAKLFELLGHQRITPTGIVLIGAREREMISYHYQETPIESSWVDPDKRDELITPPLPSGPSRSS